MAAQNQKPNGKKKDPKQEEDIFKPPMFTREPQNKQVQLGARVLLQVAAGGLPLPSYQWYFKGQPIKGAISNRLIFPKIRNEHRGNYFCSAQNYVGKVMSKEIMISIMPRATINLKISPSEAQLKRGKKFCIQLVSPSLEKLQGFTFQWTLDGKKITGAKGPKLEFTELKPKYSGEYKLLILRGAEIKSSNISKLKVFEDHQAEKVVTVSSIDSIESRPGADGNLNTSPSAQPLANLFPTPIEEEEDFFFTPENSDEEGIEEHSEEEAQANFPDAEQIFQPEFKAEIQAPAIAAPNLTLAPQQPQNAGSLLDFLDPNHDLPIPEQLPVSPFTADEFPATKEGSFFPETSWEKPQELDQARHQDRNQDQKVQLSPDATRKGLVKRVRALYRLLEIVKDRRSA